VPVALITVADGVCHPTPAALIICRHSIYPHRGRADLYLRTSRRYRNVLLLLLLLLTKTMIRDGEIGPEQSATVYLIAGGRAGGIGCTDGRR